MILNFGIMEQGVDTLDVFHHTIFARNETFLDACVNHTIFDEVCFQMTGYYLVEEFTYVAGEGNGSEVGRETRITPLMN